MRIDIIDDDLLVLEAIKDSLESADYPVETFCSAEEFLESGAPFRAACLIVDVQLPGISGLELQRRLSTSAQRIPVIFVTAHATETDRQEALKNGAVGYLSKPFRREELLSALRGAIQQ